MGQLCIAGAGNGYLNRPDQTAERFVADPEGAGRLYRSGDLASRLPDGSYLYFGRADDQIKLRGYRIEPAEIESVLLSDPAVARTAVVAWSPTKRLPELAAFVTLRSGHVDTPAWRDALALRLSECLPAAMRPSLLDVLTDWPELNNGKTDRRRLPAPSGARLAAVLPPAENDTLDDLGERVRAIWCDVFAVETIPNQTHFFTDLGGHSLTAAIVVSRMRSELHMSHLAVVDLYRHPRLLDLAAYCRVSNQTPAPAAVTNADPPPVQSAWLCGVAQLGLLLGLLACVNLPGWLFLRGVGMHFPIAAFAILGALAPIWLSLNGLLLPLIAQRLFSPLRPGRYPLWSCVYLKFWFKRKLLQMVPSGLLAGHRWWPAYLRALGARIGKEGVIASNFLAVPELLDLGPRVHIDADAALLPFCIRGGWLILSPVKVGADACVGCGALLEAGAILPDGAVLAPQSALRAGDVAKPGWLHVGNPARPQQIAQAPAQGGAPKAAHLALISLMLLPALATWPLGLFAYVQGDQGMTALWLAPLAGLGFILTVSGLVAIGCAFGIASALA